MRLSRRRGLAAAAVALGLALAPASARATEFEVQADTALQAYEVASPWGNVVLQRRRFLQTIGLGAYNLQGRYEPGKADFRVVMLMRLNADFSVNQHLPAGQAGGETSYATQSGNGLRYVPGFQEAPLDLMYGYIEGRNLAGGLLGFRLGRQYVTDVLGWWSFDGGLVRVTTPFFVQLEAYGGVEQRGGLPLSTSRFERQGVWRGSHAGFGTGFDQPSVIDYPSYLYTEPAPAFGFAVESSGPSWIHGRFSYRRVYNTGPVLTQQFADPGGAFKLIDQTRISQERLGWSADVSKSDLGGFKAGFSYDLYSQIVATYYGGIEAYLGKYVTVGADVDYFVPTFDADSIWNWFSKSPVTTITARTAVRFTKRFDMAASGGARLWVTEGDPSTFGQQQCGYYELPSSCAGRSYVDPSLPSGKAVEQDPKAVPFSRDEKNRALTTTTDALANLSARYKFSTADLSLRAMIQAGSRGSREGVDLAGEKRLDGGRFSVGARASVYGWADPTRPDRDAVSFGYVLAGGFKPASVADFRIEWEHDTNRLVGQRYRVVGVLNLLVLK